MKKREHSNRAGFTLIELLVVIAILAILVAVGVPVYTGYIGRANDAAVTTELGAVLTAAEAANASNTHAIETITVSKDGQMTVTIEDGGTVSNDFYQIFASFYGESNAEGNIFAMIPNLKILFEKSGSYKNGATWSKNSWSPIPGST